MKVPFNWLREHVDCPLDPEDLAEKLTKGGLEVEAVVAIRPHVEGIVVAEVLGVDKHPRADRLSVCRVTDGSEEFTVVCGAPNVRKGILAPFARAGTKIPRGTVVKRAKLRGVVSEGMLCSERELELGEEAEGIMIIPPGASAGEPLSDALRLNDHVLDIAVTPNRPDCLSIAGVAREVAALLGKPLRKRTSGLRESGPRTRDLVRVSIENGEICPRYTARIIRGVKVGRSPFWLRNRLGMAGVRAVNNVVDATNYILVEYGQPLHAFDFKKIAGARIVVRSARRGERIATIDGKERRLEEGMLVVADGEAPVAIAGIMGGLGTEVRTDTEEILLESAFFEPKSVRRTSKKLNLGSDSSYRFERGVDYDGVVPASDRAAFLISELAGGEVCRGAVDCLKAVRRSPRVTLRVSRMNAVLNTAVSRKEAGRILERLHMDVSLTGKDSIRVTVPSYRVDIQREIDLIEEVARLKGYDAIPAVPPRGMVATGAREETTLGREKLREALCALGFSEAICLSFMGGAEMDRLMWPLDHPLRRAVKLRNPVSEEYCYLRTSLLPPLMRSVGLTVGRGNSNLRLFELGCVFTSVGSGPPLEEEMLALIAVGRRGAGNWCSSPPEVDFFYVKGVLESLLGGTGLSLIAKRSLLAGCHPGRSAELLLEGEKWGRMGEILPGAAASYNVKGRIIFAEVAAAPLLKALAAEKRYRPLPRFPCVKRDIAVIADEGVDAGSIVSSVRKSIPGLIEDVEIFDLYRGKPIPEGKKGVALSVTLRSRTATLTERDIAEAMAKIQAALKELGCRHREQ